MPTKKLHSRPRFALPKGESRPRPRKRPAAGSQTPTGRRVGLRRHPGERTHGNREHRPPQISVQPRLITDGPPQRIRFTNTDKLLFPYARITKADVLGYYERIAPWLLPYLRNRPVTVERLPEGLAGRNPPHFWQKNTPDYYPSWIPRVEFTTETGKLVRYSLVNDVETLLFLVNQGALAFHTSFSTIENLARPDFVLFDLDPGRADMDSLIAVAKCLHRRCEQSGVGCMLKTSGEAGLHLIAPATRQSFAEARAWAIGIADEVAATLPDIATTQQKKAKRCRRVYIDVIQNALGHHAVPPYVIRATPHATVSTPLDWDELSPRLNPQKFTINTIFQRLKR